MPAMHSPTVRRRRLASELRKLRESRGMTCEEVAGHLECSPSKISRMETGRVSIHPRDVRDLLSVYEVADDQGAELIEISREARERGWWEIYDDILSRPHLTYLGLEAEAAHIRTYEAQIVPGLVQTEAYARALLCQDPFGRSQEDVDQYVAARLERQHLLTVDKPLELWAIIDEAVIRRPVGGPSVMTEQLIHLLELDELPNVTIRTLPFNIGAHVALSGAFVVMEFPEPADPDIVYLENLSSGLYIEDTQEIIRYRAVFDRILTAASSRDESRALIARLAQHP